MKIGRYAGTAAVTAALLAATAVVAASAAPADEAANGRQIAAKFGDAVVRVQLVLKVGMSYPGSSSPEKQERKLEALGTVVDPSGLTVISYSMISPGESYPGSDEFKISSEVADVKIRLADGKEIPAKVVLRDKDLDLAFIRPAKKPDTPMSALDLRDSAKPDVLDRLIVLERLGKVANRTLTVCRAYVEGVVDKPRRFYVIGPGCAGTVGSPVLTEDGKAVGLLLIRSTPGGSGGSRGWDDMDMAPVVVPAEDIAAAAAQAPEKAPKEEKPAKLAKPTQPTKPTKPKTSR